MKTTLRHSTIALTLDTYTSLLPQLDREIAEQATGLIPRAPKAPPDSAPPPAPTEPDAA